MLPGVFRACLACLLAAVLAGGCHRRTSGAPAPVVAAANSYLAAALRDLLGEGTPILVLAEPGMCPGHFDPRPSQITSLRSCRLLARFEFQAAVDERVEPLVRDGLRIVSVAIERGLCEPDAYLDACRQVAAGLVAADLLAPAAAEQRMAAIQERMAQLAAWARQRVRAGNLEGKRVVASRHQAAFCRFLGLEVAATFGGADAALVSDIDRVIAHAHDAKIIVANLPEGCGLADALAERLGARVAVFGNFPNAAYHRGQFDELLRDNVRQLKNAALASERQVPGSACQGTRPRGHEGTKGRAAP